ncbi:MAG: tripartite tricarboxylate transporter substrate binding protein [Alphaproteobacteria bacterium]|nr:tripartite tricarboxylate transporter substrate binding protein [Alphaproteobacteria bacterium]
MRRLLGAAGLLFVAVAASMAATAAPFPPGPVHIVVPYTPGGPVDILARLLGQKLNDAWHQPVVIDNKPGAGGNLGTELVARARPDGATLLINTPAIVIAPSVFATLPYDPIKDFAAVINIGRAPAVLVINPKQPYDSVSGLIAYAKAHPGELNFGSPGTGGSLHLAGELFASRAGIKMVHVPYKGVQPALVDIMGGNIQMMFDAVVDVMPFVKDGRLKALAISTAQRSPLAPDLPTVAESGLPGFDFSLWYGLFAPAATPAATVQQINRDVAQLLAQPAMKSEMQAHGLDILANSPDEFGAALKTEEKTWAELVHKIGLTPN